jgi:hypothetical protein
MAVNRHKIDILQTLLLASEEGEEGGLDKMAIISLAAAAADPKRWLVTNWGIYTSGGIRGNHNSYRSWIRISTPYIMQRFTVIPSLDGINIMVCCQLGERTGHDPIERILRGETSQVNILRDWWTVEKSHGGFCGTGLFDKPNDRVGSRDGNACCYMFNTNTCATTRLTTMPYAAFELAGCCLADGSFFVCGGVMELAREHLTNRGAIFRDGKWIIVKGVMTRGRHLHQCTLMGDGRVLVTGGSYGKDDECEIFDPATGFFTAAGVMPLQGLRMHTAVLMSDDRILVCGGQHNNRQSIQSKAAIIYDPSSGRWSPAGPGLGLGLGLGSMILRRAREHSAVVIDHPIEGECVLVAGGAVMDAPNIYVESEIFVMSKNVWKLAPEYDSYKNDVVIRVLRAAEKLAGFKRQQLYSMVLFGY